MKAWYHCKSFKCYLVFNESPTVKDMWAYVAPAITGTQEELQQLLNQQGDKPMPTPAPRGRTAPAGRTTPAMNARMLAAQQAKKRAEETQAKRERGSRCVKWDGDFFSAEHGTTTILSVIPYTVTEKHHPEGVAEGEIYYKRGYTVHPDIGVGDSKHRVVCPRSFNSRAKCDVCDEIEILRQAVRDRRKELAEKDYYAELESVSRGRGKKRELMLVYHHGKDKVMLMDEAVGGGNMTGFPVALTDILINPPRSAGEDAAAFYLDGQLAKAAGIPGEGMALEIHWKGSDPNRKNDWIKATRIDFAPRKEAKVPDWAWEKTVDLSTLLVKTSNEDLWAEYQGIEEDEQDAGSTDPEPSQETPPTTRGRTRTVEPPKEPEPEQETEEEGDTPEDDIPFDQMTQDELIAFAVENGLLTPREGKAQSRKTLDEVYVKVTGLWDEKQAAEAGDEEPEASGENQCPAGYEYGKDCLGDDKPACKTCPDLIFDACQAICDGVAQ